MKLLLLAILFTFVIEYESGKQVNKEINFNKFFEGDRKRRMNVHNNGDIDTQDNTEINFRRKRLTNHNNGFINKQQNNENNFKRHIVDEYPEYPEFPGIFTRNKRLTNFNRGSINKQQNNENNFKREIFPYDPIDSLDRGKRLTNHNNGFINKQQNNENNLKRHIVAEDPDIVTRGKRLTNFNRGSINKQQNNENNFKRREVHSAHDDHYHDGLHRLARMTNVNSGAIFHQQKNTFNFNGDENAGNIAIEKINDFWNDDDNKGSAVPPKQGIPSNTPFNPVSSSNNQSNDGLDQAPVAATPRVPMPVQMASPSFTNTQRNKWYDQPQSDNSQQDDTNSGQELQEPQGPIAPTRNRNPNNGNINGGQSLADKFITNVMGGFF